MLHCSLSIEKKHEQTQNVRPNNVPMSLIKIGCYSIEDGGCVGFYLEKDIFHLLFERHLENPLVHCGTKVVDVVPLNLLTFHAINTIQGCRWWETKIGPINAQ